MAFVARIRMPIEKTKFLKNDFGKPFPSADDAWFWTLSSLTARRDGSGGAGVGARRPCDPDDVMNCIERLYQARLISLSHAHVLRIWGERGVAPDPASPNERSDAKLWREAMRRMAFALRRKGIVADAHAYFTPLTTTRN